MSTHSCSNVCPLREPNPGPNRCTNLVDTDAGANRIAVWLAEHAPHPFSNVSSDYRTNDLPDFVTNVYSNTVKGEKWDCQYKNGGCNCYCDGYHTEKCTLTHKGVANHHC